MGTTFSNHDIHPTLACDPTEVRIPSYSSLYDQLTPVQHSTDVGSGGGHDAGDKEEENPVEEEEGGRGGSGGFREGMLGLMMIGQ
jgi:hypothetical protein